MKNKGGLVSVVLPVKNGFSTLERSLNSLITQTYSKIEIIIVDNFSSDGTVNLINQYRFKDKRIKLFQKGPERASQMNFAISKATGEYIFITNCDFVVDRDFIELAVKKCVEEGFETCNGHIRSETSGFWSKVKAMERGLYVNDSLMETALFFNKNIFSKLGYFDKRMVGVEEEFQHRLDEAGIKLGIIPAFQTHIDEIDSLKEILLKSFYYGLYDAVYFKKHPVKAFKKRFPIRKAFFKNYRILIKRIDLLSGFLIFKMIQYSAGLTGLVLGLFFSPLKKKIQARIYGQ